jgi:hypothetical protein
MIQLDLWLSTDIGDAHRVDCDLCDSMEGAICRLKIKLKML